VNGLQLVLIAFTKISQPHVMPLQGWASIRAAHAAGFVVFSPFLSRCVQFATVPALHRNIVTTRKLKRDANAPAWARTCR
jgi:hypothetical protein